MRLNCLIPFSSVGVIDRVGVLGAAEGSTFDAVGMGVGEDGGGVIFLSMRERMEPMTVSIWAKNRSILVELLHFIVELPTLFGLAFSELTEELISCVS